MKQHHWLTLAITILLNIPAAYGQGATSPGAAGPKPFLLPVGGKNQRLGAQAAPALLKEHLGLGDRDQVIPLGSPVTGSGRSFQRFQQYHGGIKVEHGVYRLHTRQGVPDLITGELYRVPAGLSLRPSLSEGQALGRALAYVGAQTYQWEAAAEAQQLNKQRSDFRANYYPKGELVLCGVYQRDGVRVSDGGIALAYKFDVYAARPLSRAYIYVDAHSGAVIHQNAILKHVDGTGHTRYSGSRTLSTSAANGSYRLRDASRGQGVEVYNMRGNTYPGAAVDFTDNDNQWTAAEHDNALMDNAALDAHWGAALTYDYFRNVHGRNSIDGNGSKIQCYVHFGQGVVNAFWDGTSVFLGDGGYFNGALVQPLSTLDITAHEIGHGICQYTADLVYSYESGALNEGFSDIWGAAVENYANAGKALWTMGEDADFTIRSFSNPNQFDQPDTYLGDHWYTGGGDNGGVHYNSGVLNHWFYLLSVGKTGVNDNGESYAVTGIGLEKAARIAYRTESVYLTANSQYVDACIFSMQAAADLYGANSPEALQTANAWRAVGVYQYASAPSGLTATAASTTQANLSWRDNATGETGYQIERSTSRTQGFALVGTAGANATTYQDRDVPTNAIYHYRVRAVTGNNTYTGYSNVAAVTLGAAPIIMRDGSQTVCNAVFLDPGGTDNYANYHYATMQLSPSTPGSKLRVTFSAFDTEAGADVLRVYDGSSTSDPLIGTYSGNSLPPALTATNAGGHLTFQFYADGSVTRAGWQATLTCVVPPGAPASLTATAASTTQINLGWADNATDETGFSIERATAAGGPFASVATVAANAVAYQDRGLATDARYHYRVRAYRNDVHSAYSNEASAVVGTPPLIMSNSVVTTCNAVLLDPGGPGEYRNYENVTMTLVPASAGERVRLSFTAFDTEAGLDVLRVYDGNSIYDPLIGTYSGTALPPVITAAQTSGRLTLQFTSDYGSTRAGWRAAVSCVTPPGAPTALAATAASATAVALQWTDNAADETGFAVERSLVPGAGFTEIARVGANARAYTDPNLATNNRYYYRVRAYRGEIYSAYSNEGSATLGNAPIIMGNMTLATCSAGMLDPGGTGNYPSSQQLTMVLTPATAGRKLTLVFSAFHLDYGDYLYVYDGASTSAPLLGSYTGSTIPPRITAGNATGQLTFRFYADSYGTAAGWQAAVSCADVPAAPAGLTATAASATQINLRWTDNATGESGFYVERSLSPDNGFTQIAAVGANVTTYASNNLATDSYYFYRVRAYTGDFPSAYSNVASAAVGNPPILMRNGTVTTCNAVFRDSGGTGNYADSEYKTLTLSPVDATQRLRITFSAFATEPCCDNLTIYDGGSTSAPRIGSYGGYSVPPIINATNAEGKLTLVFYSDGSIVGSGWEAAVTCVSRPVPAITRFTPVTGPVGTLVTIEGVHLGNATAVRFPGNVSAVFTQHSDVRITATVPAGAVSGPIQVVTPAGSTTSAGSFTVTQQEATVALSQLTPAYDGTPKRVTVTTIPAGLNVLVTYNGAANPPTLPGAYAVVATVQSNTHRGEARGTLTISQAQATMQVTNLLQTYDGTPKRVTVATTPAGLNVVITYNGVANPPTLPGSYAVVATVQSNTHRGEARATLVIGKAQATVQVTNLLHTFDGTPKRATVTTQPAGLAVTVTYNGAATPPTNAGSYEVVATVESNTHQGQARGTLVIGPAQASLQVTSLLHTYDGTPKTIVVTTTPAGLPVRVAYTALTHSPVDAGSYPFVVTLTGSNYAGSTQGTLVVGKAAQTVVLPAFPDVTFGEAPLQLSASASSGLPVQVSLTGPASLQGSLVTPTQPGKVTISVRQDGNQNYTPAVAVERTFCVLPPKPVVRTADSPTEVQLTSSSTEGNQWLLDGEPVAGATGAAYLVTKAGSYSVRVSIGGCENVSEAVVLTANEEKPGASQAFRVFPNPATGPVRVTYAASQPAKSLKVVVYNSLGQRVTEKVLTQQRHEWSTTLQLVECKAGLYVFSLVDDQNRVISTRRVVKP